MKFSFGKTAFALAVVNIYLLLFSTVGSMEVIPKDDKTNDSGLVIDNNINTFTRTNDNSIGGVPVNIKTTGVENTTAPTTYTTEQTVSSSTVYTTEKKPVSSIDIISTTIKKAQTTIPTTTTTSTTTIKTTAPPVATTPQTTSPPSNNVFNEKLTVYDKLTKKYVTDTAYNLVCQNVLAEMHPSYFQPEALKAQAVATYNHIKYKNGKAELPLKSFDTLKIYNATTREKYQKKIEDAVSAVLGKIMYVNGKAIDAAYFASSAGTTLSAKDVWGGYLAGHERVLTPFDKDDKYYGIQTFIKADDVKKEFLAEGITLSSNAQSWFKVTSYITGKYVDKVVAGTKTISGVKFRDILDLKSSAFEIEYFDETDVFVIKTYGYGHGVGLSQNGANILALQGKDYQQILKTYYTGITIK